MLSDVEKDTNLMLTPLTPVATLLEWLLCCVWFFFWCTYTRL